MPLPQCQPFKVGWSTGWTAPLSLYFLPERQPPISLDITNPNASFLNWTVGVSAGTQVSKSHEIGASRARTCADAFPPSVRSS